MSKNKITNKIIFVIINIINFALCEYEVNLDGETCRNSPDNPPYAKACTSYHSKTEACCFAKVLLPSRRIINKCIPIPKDARFALNYLTIFSFKDNNNVEYKDVIATFDCGQKDRLCGMASPKKLFQCSEHSSTTHSCCYLSTPTYTECILSSDKYDKETKFQLFETSTVICYSKFIKIGKLYFILYFIIVMSIIL